MESPRCTPQGDEVAVLVGTSLRRAHRPDTRQRRGEDPDATRVRIPHRSTVDLDTLETFMDEISRNEVGDSVEDVALGEGVAVELCGRAAVERVACDRVDCVDKRADLDAELLSIAHANGDRDGIACSVAVRDARDDRRHLVPLDMGTIESSGQVCDYGPDRVSLVGVTGDRHGHPDSSTRVTGDHLDALIR
jgi:hypothetical protein